jgi:rod shape-determining protein MreD
MTPSRFLLGAATVLTALLLQTTVVARLPVPGQPPDLVLVLVLAFALCEGPWSGLVTGFVAGLLADLQSDHELGRLALVYLVVGYFAGLVQDDHERSTTLPFLVVVGAALAALGICVGEGLLLDDPRTSAGVLGVGQLASVAYDLVLTPFVVPVVGLLVRRVDLDPVIR